MVFLSYIFAGLAAGSLVYYALSLLAAKRFEDQSLERRSTSAPPVSILKPLKGCDPEMYECLRSHCTQAYSEFEIIFGVNDAADEAVHYVQRLKQEFPAVAIRLCVSREILGANRKVSNMVRMLREARYEHVLINDGDIRVPANYLRDVLSEFAAPSAKKVGIVTCLYRGVAGKTIWSSLEAMGINVDFMSGVLTARLLDGDVRFALGSTMATTKEAIDSIGGLETLADYLADDYELGKRISEKKYRAVVARPVVETLLPDYDLKSFLDHQLRWARTVRSSRPGGYFGMMTTFGPLWASLALVVSGGAAWAWVLFACVLAVKVASLIGVGKVIGDRETLAHLWLVPLRELVTLAVWLMSWFGNSIVWHGERFTLREGKLYR